MYRNTMAFASSIVFALKLYSQVSIFMLNETPRLVHLCPATDPPLPLPTTEPIAQPNKLYETMKSVNSLEAFKVQQR